MKILSASQIKLLDSITIAKEPIRSIDLMERVAMICTRRLMKLIPNEESIYVICGKGNNGGDGLAIARLLLERGYTVTVCVINYKKEFSVEADSNYKLLQTKYPDHIFEINSIKELTSCLTDHNSVIIDALIGSGLNKPIKGFLGEVIKLINSNFKNIISIDVPSGLFIDSTSLDNPYIIQSTLTLSLQFPKLAFLLPENSKYIPQFELVDIGLHKDGIAEIKTKNYYVTASDIFPLIKKRHKFDHKGSFGHALLFAGSKGKAGAAIISAKACLRSGAGLLTVHSTKEVLTSMLSHLPEAMSEADTNSNYITKINNPENYAAIGFGPGVGVHKDTQKVLKSIISKFKGKLIIDADGLNILSENKTWLNQLPKETILTPHVKEFERLVGKSKNDFERLEKLKHFSAKYQCIVILKGAHSVIAMPDGDLFFNSTGNPGLAKAGSGDALTGIILGLLCRGYNSAHAALIGTYVHGFSADLCLKKMSMESILISDVIKQLPKAFKKLEKIPKK
jgi:hydroxyethylthiazole kinase-like uncharacterized protein yjeF